MKAICNLCSHVVQVRANGLLRHHHYARAAPCDNGGGTVADFGTLLCQGCDKEHAQAPHPCVYKQELYNDDAPCNCCAGCHSNCAMEV